MTTTYDIVPGKSIGPFELGMTRDEIEGLGVQPMARTPQEGTYFPLVDLTEEELALWSAAPYPGVNVSYDADGRCCEISAIFAWDPTPPVFTLLGEVVNGMTLETAADLARSVASDVRRGFGSISSAAGGVSAAKWERDDDCIMCVSVKAPA